MGVFWPPYFDPPSIPAEFYWLYKERWENGPIRMKYSWLVRPMPKQYPDWERENLFVFTCDGVTFAVLDEELLTGGGIDIHRVLDDWEYRDVRLPGKRCRSNDESSSQTT